MNEITKAVIPAAGRGTRMRPLTNYMSKTMLPLGKKPVLQHIIEELKEAGINEIGVVVRSDDQRMVDYFKDDTAVQFIFDDSLSGPGGAILKTEAFVNTEDFVVIFADAPLQGRGRGNFLKKLISLKIEKNVRGALAIYPIEKEKASARGVVKFEGEEPVNDEIVRLTDMEEKPFSVPAEPWATACRYVLDSKLFEFLKDIAPDDKGERQLTPAIRKMIRKGEVVVGYPLPEGLSRHDTGNFEGYFKALRAFIPPQ